MKQSGQSLPPENLQEILDSAKNAADLGTQQFVTPPALAQPPRETYIMPATLVLSQCRNIVNDFRGGKGNKCCERAISFYT